MATNDTKAKIVLEAKDKASRNIKKVNDSFVKLVAGVTAGNIAANIASKAMGSLAGGIRQLVDATKVAARIQVLNRVFLMTGQNAGHTQEALEDMKFSLIELGIAEQEALQIGQRFIQAQLDIADATLVARAAQDLAVIAGTDSSTTALQLTDAIVKQRPILLKQFGIIANLNDIYGRMAKTVGKSVDALTESEKRTAFLNEILRQSKTVAGAYESAMKDVGKQMTSLPRHMQNAQNAVGKLFLPAMKQAVSGTKDFLIAIRDIANALNVDLAESFKSARRSGERMTELTDKVADLSFEYEELITIVKPTTAEQERLKEVTQEIAKIVPSAVTEWDKYGKAVKISEENIIDFISAQERVFQADRVARLKALVDEMENLGHIDIDQTTSDLNGLIATLNQLKDAEKADPTPDSFQTAAQTRRAAMIFRTELGIRNLRKAQTEYNTTFDKLVATADQAFPKLIEGTNRYAEAQRELTPAILDALLKEQERAKAAAAAQITANRLAKEFKEAVDLVSESLLQLREDSTDAWEQEQDDIKVTTEDVVALGELRELDFTNAAAISKKLGSAAEARFAKRRLAMRDDITALRKHNADQGKLAADFNAEMLGLITRSTSASVQNMVASFGVLRTRSKTIFGQMAQDFIQEFVNRVLKALISSAIFGILNIFSGGSFSFGREFLGQLGIGGGGSPQAPAGGGANTPGAALGPFGSAGAGIQLVFNGPVTSQRFVLEEMIPLLEASVITGGSRLVQEETNLTGVDNASFI